MLVYLWDRTRPRLSLHRDLSNFRLRPDGYRRLRCRMNKQLSPHRYNRQTRQRDEFGLLPNWRLFADRVLAGEEGTTAYRKVFKNAKITSARVSACKLLQRPAVKAAESWVYEPGIKDGVPVKVWIKAAVTFKL